MVGLPYDDNLGDPLMIDTVKKLCRRELQKLNINDTKFEIIDIMARSDEKSIPIKKNFGYVFYKVLKKATTNNRKFQKYEIKSYNYGKRKAFREYFETKIKNVDFLIFVGGALITYKYNRNFHSPIYDLIQVANDNNKKVIFNSVGIEGGYDLSYESCKMVKEYLNMPNVISISTRDDFETLKRYVPKNNTFLTSDSVSNLGSIYNCEVQKKGIGIGLIAPSKFDEYSDNSLSEEYIKIINETIEYCIMNSLDFRLFTNGHLEDYKFGEFLLKKNNLSQEYLIKKPVTYEDLINDINSFEKVICSRLHSCIIAYSFNIPFIGIDWNGKIDFFGKITDLADFIISPNNYSSIQDIIKKLSEFNEEYYQAKKVYDYKRSDIEFLRESIMGIIQVLK